MPKFRPNNSINNKMTKQSSKNNSRLGETITKKNLNGEGAQKALGNALGHG